MIISDAFVGTNGKKLSFLNFNQKLLDYFYEMSFLMYFNGVQVSGMF